MPAAEPIAASTETNSGEGPGTRFPAGPVLRTPGDLEDRGLAPDRAVRVRTARLVYAHHALLRHDFPQLENEDVDRWLLEQAAWISVNQASQSTVSTAISTVGEPLRVFRPSRYGRAFVKTLGVPGERPDGLLDLKGAGLAPGRESSLMAHSSGLLLLGDALRETLFQWLVDEIFRRAEPRFWTVPVYGLIDLGFDVRTKEGRYEPAGLLVRRAHRRPLDAVDLPVQGSRQEQIKLEIELLLRHYGLTSSNRGTRYRFELEDPGNGRTGKLRYFYSGIEQTPLSDEETEEVRGWMEGRPWPVEADGINIQTVREMEDEPSSRAQLVDFGHFEARKSFEDPVVSMAWGSLLRWHRALWPDEPGFPQPGPGLGVSPHQWGHGDLVATAADRPSRRVCEVPTLVAFDLARRFRAGELNGPQVHRRLRQIVGDTIASWPAPGGGEP